MEGSKITILFLDPRADMLERLAREEGESTATLLSNIAISMGICHRLTTRLRRDHLHIPAGGRLTIRLYDHIPYFAYHRQNNRVIVGFYFLTAEGSSSAAYEVIDEKTKRVFEDHFLRIRADATEGTLVDFQGAKGIYDFNADLFNHLRSFLETKLSHSKVTELLGGVPSPPVTNTLVPSTEIETMKQS